MKTAALFSAACELGAFISEASPPVIGALKAFGTKLGVAYQIYDDILDLAGTEEETGKTLGTDLRKGKFTLPILLLLQSGKDAATIRRLLLKEDNVDGELLVAMLGSVGALQAAKGVASRLIGEALSHLDGIHDNKYAWGLRAIPAHLSALIERL